MVGRKLLLQGLSVSKKDKGNARACSGKDMCRLRCKGNYKCIHYTTLGAAGLFSCIASAFTCTRIIDLLCSGNITIIWRCDRLILQNSTMIAP
jgi:hypothetical protein